MMGQVRVPHSPVSPSGDGTGEAVNLFRTKLKEFCSYLEAIIKWKEWLLQATYLALAISAFLLKSFNINR